MVEINKGSKRWIIILTVIILISVGIFYLWRDLNLSALRTVPLPEIIVEDIQIERVVNGKRWIIVSPRAEHRDGVIYAKSVNITIKDPSGRDYHIVADESTLTRDTNDITLTNADGTMTSDGKVYTLKSGYIEYDAQTETWNFSKGVALTSENMTISGEAGRYETVSGNCAVWNGGVVTWIN